MGIYDKAWDALGAANDAYCTYLALDSTCGGRQVARTLAAYAAYELAWATYLVARDDADQAHAASLMGVTR